MSYTRESADGSSSQRKSDQKTCSWYIRELLKDTRLKLKFYKNTKKSNAFPKVLVGKGKVFRYSDVEIFTSKTFTRSLMVQLVWINIIEAFTERPFWKVDHLVVFLSSCSGKNKGLLFLWLHFLFSSIPPPSVPMIVKCLTNCQFSVYK